ncbi:hypothetical protein C2E21_1716 [Chlorella sorokiniana]|uniref:Uncharacterized protein n=1 Tax=Chlorella sorokiniana TaxID=3076 RepID=A0A2P6U0N2_CHLSO|nr:hypothetical protein C2E21_1716 [Chlorella sorokiniana]|eukprot:PRW59877.1 hypothetical protein C2E21_1716 [Chlorella sorokiniana]
MTAEGSGQAACALKRAACWVGTGVRLLHEASLAGGVQIRYQASNGNQSEEARSHGQKVQELFLNRFEDKEGAIADVTTGPGSSGFIRITATEMQQQGEERLAGGLVVELRGNKAVIPLAAVHESFEGRGHMTYLFQKVTAGFLSRDGVSVVAVEADGGFWAQQAFELEELIDKRGRVATDLDFSNQDVRELQAMRTVPKVPLLAGPLTTANAVPLPLAAAAAAAPTNQPKRTGNRKVARHAAGAARGSGRAGSKDWYFTAGKVELRPGLLPNGLHLVVYFFGGCGPGGTDRPTIGLEDAASEAEGKAGRDLVFLVAAQACNIPAPKMLCQLSSLERAEEEKLEGIAAIKSWEELKIKLKFWRKSGALQRYVQRVAAGEQQDGGQAGEGAEGGEGAEETPQGGAPAKRRAPSSGQRRLRQRRTPDAGEGPQAPTGGEAPAEQPATPEAQQAQAQQAQQGGGAPPEQMAELPAAAAEPSLEGLLAAAVQQPGAVAAGLTQELIGQYCARRLRFPPAEQQGQEKALVVLLKLSLLTAAAELMRTAMTG